MCCLDVNMQSKFGLIIILIALLGVAYWMWFRPNKTDSYVPQIDFPIDETHQPIRYVTNDTVFGTTPVDETVPEKDNPDDFLTYFEKLYPTKHPEVRAKEMSKDKFKNAVKNLPNMTVDHLPDLPLQLQVQGVDVKDVASYNNHHMVPMSALKPKLYDGYFTSLTTRQVYPQEDGTVRVSNFGMV